MVEQSYWRHWVSRRQFLQGAAMGGAGLLGLALVGCGDGEGSQEAAGSGAGATDDAALTALIDAAKSEGKLTWYTATTPEQYEAVGAAFKSKYGIEVESIRLTSGPLGQRFAAEAEAGNVVADVLGLYDPVFFPTAVEKGWITPVKAEEIPALTAWPEQYWVHDAYARVSLSPMTIVYNTQLVSEKDAPKGWEDLLDPRWRGKILFVDPRNVPVWMAWLYLMRGTYGDDYLRRLGQQDLRLAASAVPGAQQVAAGEASIVVPSIHSVILPLLDQGAPIADVTPEPSIGSEFYVGVSTKAPHPEAARLFLNFLLTKEGQEPLNRRAGASPLQGVPDSLALPSQYYAAPVDAALDSKDQLLALLGIR